MGLLLGIAGSRIIRTAVVSVRENMYVHAAQSIGASTPRILWRHILPNVLPPIIVLFTTRVGVVILAESGLSFLGLGVPPPAPTWGGMLSGSGRSLHVPRTMAGAGAGAVPDRRRLCHQHVRRRAARSVRSAHARITLRIRPKRRQEEETNATRNGTAATWPRRAWHWRYCWALRRRWPIPTPQYGGTLEIGTVYLTLSALSWDLADWNWKQNHDTGQFYEQLFAADLSKSARTAAQHPFYADAWLPSDAIRGELAESWEWKDDPLRIEIKLRKGIMFPEKPGVMAARELIADDVIFSYTRLATSPKKIATYFDHVEKVYAADKHTVVFQFKDFNAEWDYRFGWGYYSGVMPKEVADAGAGNWKNANGTGPFMLADFVQGNSNTYVEEPHLLGQGEDQRRRVQAALRRQARLSHHQGRGDLRHRAAHRQARHAGEHSLAKRRAAQEERAAAASGRSGSTCRAPSWPCASTPSRSTTFACAAR